MIRLKEEPQVVTYKRTKTETCLKEIFICSVVSKLSEDKATNEEMSSEREEQLERL